MKTRWIAALLAIAIGLFWGIRHGIPGVKRNAPQTRAPVASASDPSRAADHNVSRKSMEDQVASLAVIGNDADRRRVTIAPFAQALEADDIRWLLAEIGGAADAGWSRDLRRMVVTRWNQIEPREAANWLVATGGEIGRELLDDVLTSWCDSNQPAALVWARELPEVPLKEQAVLQLGQRWFLADPQAALEFARNFPSGSNQLLNTLASKWVVNDPAAAATWVKELPDGNVRTRVIASMTAAWAERAPVDAARFAAGLPPGQDQSEALVSAISGWARQDPRSAAAWAGQFPTGELQNEAYTQVLFAWGRHAPADAAEWLTTLADGPARDAAASSFSGTVAERHPAIALTIAQSIGNESLRSQRIENVMRRWLERDPEAAAAALEQSALSPALAARLRSPRL